MKTTLSLIVIGVAVGLLAEVGCGSSPKSPAGKAASRISPIEHLGGASELGPVAACWPRKGCAPRYGNGGFIDVSFLIRNKSGQPVTLLRVRNKFGKPALLQFAGVQVFKYVPPPSGKNLFSDAGLEIQPPYGRLPSFRPQVLKAHETVAVQENFRMVGCWTGTKRLDNHPAVLTVSYRGLTFTQRIDLTNGGRYAAGLTVIAPKRSDCR
jgi:hypothetical protein